MEQKNMLLVDSSILPEAINRTLEVKLLLESGEEVSVHSACKRVGLSRSAYYKYKDFVFEFNEKSGRIVTIYAVLSDKPGILSRLMSQLYENGANILTVNQNIPSGSRASVSVSFRVGQLKIAVSELIDKIRALEGVKSIVQVSGE